MLFSRRKEEQRKRELEASGESLWTKEFSPETRVKIWHALTDSVSDAQIFKGAVARAHGELLRAYGVARLRNKYDPAEQLGDFLTTCDDDEVADVIEAIVIGLRAALNTEWGPHYVDLPRFERDVKHIFYTDRMAYDLIEGRIVPFESREMHESVVAPTLVLLASLRGWEAVEVAYQNALKEIGVDNSDAITDATTAVQQALLARGCSGNALGELAKSATNRGVLAAHDKVLVDWLNADRAASGDAHKPTDAGAEDAWLVVHVAGALILRLAEGTSR